MVQVTVAIYPCDVIVLPNFNDFWTILEESFIDKECFYLDDEPIEIDDNNDGNHLLDSVQAVLDASVKYYQKNSQYGWEDIERAIENTKFDIINSMITIFFVFMVYHMLSKFLYEC